MTSPKITRNVYCTDPEDRVIPYSCKVCNSCWLFVASYQGRKNGMCKDGGPFAGFDRTQCLQDNAPALPSREAPSKDASAQ